MEHVPLNNFIPKHINLKLLRIPKQNFGVIESINYGCAVIKGLGSSKMGELIRCQSTDSVGSVVKILPRRVVVLFYTNIEVLKPRTAVVRTNIPLSRDISNIKENFGKISEVL